MDCTSAREQLHDYVSGELAASQSTLVDGHLTGCPDCARAFGRWGQFRRAVHTAGAAQPTPPILRARVVERLRDARPAPAFRGWLIPLLAVLAIVVALTTVVRPPVEDAPVAGGPSAVPIVGLDRMLAGIVTDHEGHGNHLKPDDAEAPEKQRRLIETYEKRLGTALDIPPALGRGFDREQCHLCPVASERVPHIQYRSGNQSVSLFLAPVADLTLNGRKGSDIREGAPYTAQVGSESLRAWRRGGIVYVLVSREPPATLAALAQAFRAQ